MPRDYDPIPRPESRYPIRPSRVLAADDQFARLFVSDRLLRGSMKAQGQRVRRGRKG